MTSVLNTCRLPQTGYFTVHSTPKNPSSHFILCEWTMEVFFVVWRDNLIYVSVYFLFSLGPLWSAAVRFEHYSVKGLWERINNFHGYAKTSSFSSPFSPTPTFQPTSQHFPNLMASHTIEKLRSGCGRHPRRYVIFPNNLTWPAYLPPLHHQIPLQLQIATQFCSVIAPSQSRSQLI